MLYIVGIGAGSREGMTLQAHDAILRSDIIFGYTVYIEQIRRYFPEKKCIATGMRQEKERVKMALEAAQTHTAAMVCSGDAAVYGMAALAFEMGEWYDFDIEIVPGVTAALSGSAVLGAPLSNDFAVISLSDLLTPMDTIMKRLRCAAEGNFVIVLYNPSSRQRADYLKRACDMILTYRSPETVCGFVRNIGRTGQKSEVLTLGELREVQVDMFTTVFVGNTDTKVISGRMVTSRGYRL